MGGAMLRMVPSTTKINPDLWVLERLVEEDWEGYFRQMSVQAKMWREALA